MLVDGIVDLIEAGIVTNTRKQIDRGRSVFSFAIGSRKLYESIDGNPDLCAYSVDYTNTPDNISKNDNVVSINCSTQIDLQGQAASESIGDRHVSGTGGQLQFVRGAYASKDGKSFLCLSSTYRSDIQLRLGRPDGYANAANAGDLQKRPSSLTRKLRGSP
jgi:acyl-CoA hydrolase